MENSFTCPHCGMTSYNINDILHQYCGNCHKFMDQIELEKLLHQLEMDRVMRAIKDKDVKVR